MKNKILLISIVSLLLIVNINFILAANTKYYQLNFKYDGTKQQLKLNSATLKTTTGTVNYYEEEFPYENIYDIRILDSKNKVLNSGIFYTCYDFYLYDFANPGSDVINNGGVGCTDRTTFSINAPFYSNAKYISILDPNNKEIIRYDLTNKKTVPVTGKVISEEDNKDYFSWIKNFFKSLF